MIISIVKKFSAILALIIVGVLVYGLTLRGVWKNPTVSEIKESINDETRPYGIAPDRGRFLLTQNLVENRSFGLSREQAEAAAPDVGYFKGKYYIFFAPGLSILAMPFYALGTQYNLGQVSTFIMVSLFAIGNLIFIFLISKDILKLPFWSSLFGSLVFGFASTSLNYASSLYQHHTTTFLILSSFYAVWLYKKFRRVGFIFATFVWLSFGFALLVDYPNAVLMLPVMIYLLMSSIRIDHLSESIKFSIRPSIFLTAIVFVIITAGHLYYNQAHFGSWKSVSGDIIGLRAIKEKNLDQGDLDQNIKELKLVKNTAGSLKETYIVNSSYELFLAPDKGILFFSPIFIFGFLGMLLILMQKKITVEKGILIVLVVVNFLFYASWGDPWGGWAFGPRYVIPAMSVLSIFVGFWLAEVRYFKLLNRFLALLLFVFSSAISLLGAITSNAVPPKVEADPLGVRNGYLFNMDLFNKGKAGTFAYNYFFHNQMSLTDYYFTILGGIFCIALIVLFILPLFSKKGIENDFA